jgi:glycosyltransferase involved in cell wall biosynthesis
MSNAMLHLLKRRLHLSYLLVRCYVREKRRWSRPHSECGSPRVFYGYETIPGRAEAASGGIIKFQDLQPLFPNTPTGANILYLVSSALPHCAPTMVRLARKNGCRIVLNQNGTAFHGWYGKGWQTANRPMRRVLEMADYVFYQSAFCKKAADCHLGQPSCRFEILHNPVDTSVFIPSTSKGEHFRVLLAGSHHQFYRVQTAVDAFSLLLKTLPKSSLTIAGRYRWSGSEGESFDQLRDYIQQHGLEDHIYLDGAYTQEQAVGLLQRHDILLHTKYNDPCPRLVVEALSCGLPVIYSSSGGVPELVGAGGIGIPAPVDWNELHPPAPALLAEAMAAVSRKYHAYSRAARGRAVARLDVKPWLERHQHVFADVLHKK